MFVKSIIIAGFWALIFHCSNQVKIVHGIIRLVYFIRKQKMASEQDNAPKKRRHETLTVSNFPAIVKDSIPSISTRKIATESDEEGDIQG